jgi:predicted acylesterase/phospholipase RssA
MKALVLSGGGAHGAYEAGVAKALLQREQYDLVCGVSIGAINAALIAAGRTEDALERFWHHEFPANALELFPHIPRLRRLMHHFGSFGSGGAWQDAVLVARAATDLPFLRNLSNVHKTSLPAVAESLGKMLDFERLRIPLLIGATDVTHATAAVFRACVGKGPVTLRRARLTQYHDLTEENFVMALLASSAMPGLFSPIELTFGGETAQYADGCLVHTSPLGLAMDNGATEVTVVFVDQELDPETAAASQGITQTAYNIATFWQQRLLDYELRLAEATNELVRLGGAHDKREISIRYMRPRQPIDIDLLAFDDGPALARIFAQGLADGAAAPDVPATVPASSAPEETKPRTIWGFTRRLFPRTAEKPA